MAHDQEVVNEAEAQVAEGSIPHTLSMLSKQGLKQAAIALSLNQVKSIGPHTLSFMAEIAKQAHVAADAADDKAEMLLLKAYAEDLDRIIAVNALYCKMIMDQIQSYIPKEEKAEKAEVDGTDRDGDTL